MILIRLDNTWAFCWPCMNIEALKYDNFLYMGCPLRIKAAADKGKGGGKGKDKEDEVTIVVP